MRPMLILMFALTGCASMLNGPKDEVFIKTDPPMEIKVDNFTIPPGGRLVSFNRSSRTHHVIPPKGYEAVPSEFTADFEAVWVVWQVLFPFGPLGIIVDLAAESNYNLPSEISIYLKKEK